MSDKPEKPELESADAKERKPARAVTYVAWYPLLVEVARKYGYALCVHGSVQRDMDLVAVPWTDEASDPLTLIKALKEATGCVTHQDEMDHYYPDCDPKEKPHGRVAYSLHCSNRGCFGAYLDVSVMPRRKDDRETVG